MLRLVANSKDRLPEEKADLVKALNAASFLADDELADIIVEKCADCQQVDLELFLGAIPQLATRPVALDAAIEITLKSMRAGGMGAKQACEVLVSRHPEIETAIRTADALAEAMVDTTLLAVRNSGSGELVLPCDLGPKLANGEQRYRLHQILGVGSQGAVYLGQDRSLSEPGSPAWVAVKQVGSDFDGEEASKARRVIHPNVVRVLDRVRGPGSTWAVVFEYVRGGSLEAERRQVSGRFPIKRAVEIVLSAAQGVQAAHSAGLVHRDLKPANILIGEGGEAKVSDFGISHRMTDVPSQGRMGSLGFMSPQQFRGAMPVVQDDVYALGGLLYWLLTDQVPNGLSRQAATEALSKNGPGQELSLRLQRPDIDADLDAICRRALSSSAESRYASADGFANDLRAWLSHEPISWTSPTPLHRYKLAFRRSPLAWGLAGGVGVLLIAMLLGSVYFVVNAEVARQRAEIEKLEAEQAKQKQTVEHAQLFTNLTTKYLRSAAAEGPGAAWLCVTGFVESMMKQRLPIDPVEANNLWEKRVQVAEECVRQAEKLGTRAHLESLMIESSLCLWLLRENRAKDAITHLDYVEPHWKAILHENDEWLKYLRIFRACANVLAVNPQSPDAEELRVEQYKLAEKDAATLADVDAEPITSLLGRVKPMSLR